MGPRFLAIQIVHYIVHYTALHSALHQKVGPRFLMVEFVACRGRFTAGAPFAPQAAAVG